MHNNRKIFFKFTSSNHTKQEIQLYFLHFETYLQGKVQDSGWQSQALEAVLEGGRKSNSDKSYQ